ncbi:hypothetical protein RJ639_043630 [Escallonia herrerae]|uniref:Glycosyl transferase family 1 domain-containing protein n=1 Tax=Escallonia herrerae TaxID=1293975 RepID=A0AA89B0I4_9ASTE|nr:hypothetical protein RJ639_043630 [Escallonia herrerae]
MGSVENGLAVKRDLHLLRSSSVTNGNGRNPFGQRPRSRLARFVLFKKIDYLQWICTVAVFLFFVVLFQMFLPGSVMEKSGDSGGEREGFSGDLTFLKEIGGLDFGEDIKFEPTTLMLKFAKEAREANMSSGSRRGVRFGFRKPKLALVFADLLVDQQQILMVTVAVALQEIGYDIEPIQKVQASFSTCANIRYGVSIWVYSLEDGPVADVWRNKGIGVKIVEASDKIKTSVDWLNYDGILLSSLEARPEEALVQEPYKSVPLIWTIQESALATRSRQYFSSGQIELVDDWKKVFNRATVIVFPNHVLPILYSAFDSGNYYVIPGSPAEAWEADRLGALHRENPHDKINYGPDDFVIVVVGSQFLYRGLWLEHALVLQALSPLLADFPSETNSNPHLKIVILSGELRSNYSVAVEAIALNLRYPKGSVTHVSLDEDADSVLSRANFVIYGSFLEEQSFPDLLIRAMCFGKPIAAPDLSMIRKYQDADCIVINDQVDDRVNGYLFPRENIRVLTQIMSNMVSKGKLSPLAHNVASIGKRTAKNLMVSETVEGYASLLENVLKLPSEVAFPPNVSEIPLNLKAEWQWHSFEAIAVSEYPNITLRIYKSLDRVEKQMNHTQRETSGSMTPPEEIFVRAIWEEEKSLALANTGRRREEEELKGRSDQARGTWEEVYRSAKKADRSRNDLHERDEGELERTGQPLCIYEPYFGEGTWPFLHRTSLYRGLGLSTKGRRPGADDVDAPSRLPLLNNPYYRDVLGEVGAFFAIANRIDRIHKNAWIGFQSWRATARKMVFIFGEDVRPDLIPLIGWRFAFSEALKKMYGIKQDWNSLPPMPVDGDTWSVMHSWVLPTRSFLEFVMFSRIFVDALDAQIYEEHRQSGHCFLSLYKDKHCYSRVLELLVNIWAYHSARRMVYVNPKTGLMQEQHRLKSRRGQMWVKWFQYTTVKSMDEDLAEESDSDHPRKRWLWPSTGEVFWQGVYEKERNQRNKDKEKRRQQSKDKIKRIKGRTHQKVLGRFVKPPPEQMDNSNSTAVAASVLR